MNSLNPQQIITVVFSAASLDYRFAYDEPFATEYCIDAPAYIPNGSGNQHWIPREV